MGDLGKWANDNNQFFKLEAGQSILAEYKGFKIIPNNFDPEKESIRYTLVIDGITKYWNNGSTKVAECFDKVRTGDKVKISKEATKDGKGKYFVEAVTEESMSFDKIMES